MSLPERRDATAALLGQFAASLAHDLRTPLMAIRMLVEVVRRSAPSTPELSDALNMMNDAVEDSNQLLINLVEISHEWAPKCTAVNLESLISEVVALVDDGRSVRWRFDFRQQPPEIWGDRTRLKQVFQKLLRNSMTAMQGQGDVDISSRRTTDGDVIEIRDTGPGIAGHLRSRVFEPFVTTKSPGMGLGLTYCREVIRRHGGSISLVESPLPGALFRIVLPRTNARSSI